MCSLVQHKEADGGCESNKDTGRETCEREWGMGRINRLYEYTSAYMCVNKCTAVADKLESSLSLFFSLSRSLSLCRLLPLLVLICGLPSPWRRSASETIHWRNKYIFWMQGVRLCVCACACADFYRRCRAHFTHHHLQPIVWKKDNKTIHQWINIHRQQMSNGAWNLPKILSQVPPTRTFSTSNCNVFDCIYIPPHTHTHSHAYTHSHRPK